ncbi:MAG: Uma2 family endonuclease [Bryobacteraceae bacterium]
MGAQRVPAPLTVEEWARIPDPAGGHYELHHGELAFVTYPIHRHKALQRRLRKLLEHAAEPVGYVVDSEFPYRPFPENEVWGADVAVVSKARYDAIEKWLLGSPELVIEVKSPSNSSRDMQDKAMTTLAGEGAVEFWIVDPETRTITVHSKRTGMHVYSGGETVSPFVTGLPLCSPADLFDTP